MSAEFDVVVCWLLEGGAFRYMTGGRAEFDVVGNLSTLEIQTTKTRKRMIARPFFAALVIAMFSPCPVPGYSPGWLGLAFDVSIVNRGQVQPTKGTAGGVGNRLQSQSVEITSC
jgi:hypothetical protein